MPYDRPHLLMQWSGLILTSSGADPNAKPFSDFSGSLRFASTAPGPLSEEVRLLDNDGAMDQVIQKLTSFWTSADSFIPHNFQVTTLKWNLIGEDGRYISTDNTRMREGLNIYGRKPPGVPCFVALASTYTTAARRGLASKGRTYWPFGGFPESPAAFLTQQQQDLYAAHVAGFIRSLGNWSGIDVTSVAPSVMSNRRGGATRKITGVSIGGELDVQQRRRVDRETYRSAVV